MYKKDYHFIYFQLLFSSYLLGYIVNENSIGSGDYDGDLLWIWENFEIF